MKTKKEILDSMLRSDDYKNAVGDLSPQDKKKFNELLAGQILPFLHKLDLVLRIDEEDNLDYSAGEDEWQITNPTN